VCVCVYQYVVLHVSSRCQCLRVYMNLYFCRCPAQRTCIYAFIYIYISRVRVKHGKACSDKRRRHHNSTRTVRDIRSHVLSRDLYRCRDMYYNCTRLLRRHACTRVLAQCFYAYVICYRNRVWQYYYNYIQCSWPPRRITLCEIVRARSTWPPWRVSQILHIVHCKIPWLYTITVPWWFERLLEIGRIR
jgi:hypothetical protein